MEGNDNSNIYKEKILEEEINKLKIEIENNKLISELLNSQKLLLNKIESLEKSYDNMTEKINLLQNKNTTN
jgi:hypothetical protein